MIKKIGTLGPKGSYSEILCKKICEQEDLEIELFSCIEDIFLAIKTEKISYGIIPIENMIHGSVRETTIGLKNYDVKINKGYDLGIHHCFAAKEKRFSKIVSHPQAIAQCSMFLKEQRAQGREVIESSSTSQAMQMAAEDQDYAAIGSKTAAKDNNLLILEENIENNSANVTRFVLISKDERSTAQKENVKTSMIIMPSEDRPGILFEILSLFKIKNINMTKIESIPTGDSLGRYIFYVDIEGNNEEENIKKTIEFMQTIVDIKVLGSYEVINCDE